MGEGRSEAENSSDTLTLLRKCKQGNRIYGLWSVGKKALGFGIERTAEPLTPGLYQAELVWNDQEFCLPHYQIIGKDEERGILILPSFIFGPGHPLAEEYYMGIVTIGQDYSLLQNSGHSELAIGTQLKEIIDVSIENDYYDQEGDISMFKGMIASGLRVN